jgi:predicted RNA binding protein YcfA (HicA-like mRNA interferase family)
MSTIEKLLERLRSIPSDLKYSEVRKILNHLGYKESTKGATSGSRILFYNEENQKIMFHKPHGKEAMKKITIKQIISALRTHKKLS